MAKKLGKIVLFVFGGLFLLGFVLLAVGYQPDIPVEQLVKKYATPPSAFVDIQGMKVHYRDEGPRSDSVPLVLLHGTSSSLFTWNACTAEWSRNHRVIRMDLPGFGLTGPGPGNDYSIPFYVSFLEQFLQSRQVTSCYIAGNSLGGLIATAYAAQYPARVKKVILIDPAGYPIHNARSMIGFRLARMPVVRNIVAIVTPVSLVRKSVEGVYGDPSRVTEALVQQYHDLTCREGNRAALILRMNSPEKPDTTLTSKVNQPVLIIWGDLDQVIPVANAAKFQRDLPHDTLVIFPGVGHVPMEERPDKVVEVVKRFIE